MFDITIRGQSSQAIENNLQAAATSLADKFEANFLAFLFAEGASLSKEALFAKVMGAIGVEIGSSNNAAVVPAPVTQIKVNSANALSSVEKCEKALLIGRFYADLKGLYLGNLVTNHEGIATIQVAKSVAEGLARQYYEGDVHLLSIFALLHHLEQIQLDSQLVNNSQVKLADMAGTLTALFVTAFGDAQGKNNHRLFMTSTGINYNAKYGGNCATFVSTAWLYSRMQTWDGWNLGPTERDFQGDQRRYYVGNANYRVVGNLDKAFYGSGQERARFISSYPPSLATPGSGGYLFDAYQSIRTSEEFRSGIGPGDLLITYNYKPGKIPSNKKLAPVSHPGEAGSPNSPLEVTLHNLNHVALIVGWGPTINFYIPKRNQINPLPFFATYAEAEQFYLQEPDVFRDVYQAIHHEVPPDSPPFSVMPWAIDHTGAYPDTFPRPYGRAISGLRESSVHVFIDLKPNISTAPYVVASAYEAG